MKNNFSKFKFLGFKKKLLEINSIFWVASIISALLAVIYSKIFFTIENLIEFFYQKNSKIFLILTPAAFVVSRVIIVKFKKEAGGSGIPQVLAAIEIEAKKGINEFVDKLLDLKVIIFKILSSSIVLLGGGAIGNEAPTIQLSASVFHLLGRKFTAINKHLESWIIAGSAAGLSAAFNTPIGGIVYAVEELAISHIHQLKRELIFGILLSGYVVQVILGPYLYLDVVKIDKISFYDLKWVIFISALSGILGALFGLFVYKLQRLMQSFSFKNSLYFSAFLGAIVACLGVFSTRYGFGSGKKIMTELLSNTKFETVEVLKIFIVRFFNSLLSFVGASVGGILVPSLTAGSTFGFLVSKFFNLANGNLYILTGMTSFLTGLTRMPLTAFVLVVEMTNQYNSLLSVMLASIVAFYCANFVEKDSVYQKIKKEILEEENLHS
jgi:H+/Cl- antiporter ClcA